ncbi:MAG: T9SS type A sorting domain-containing protein [Flavobacteriales bacterium]
MRKLLTLLVTINCIAATGQLVYIPDVQFRDVLNTAQPGFVDVDGNMDPLSWSVFDLEFTVDWTPADLDGIEALGFNNLVIHFDPGVVLTWDTMPLLNQLDLENVPLTALPYMDPAIEMQGMFLRGAPQLTTVNPLPDLLWNLLLQDMPALTEVPVLPANMETLELDRYPAGLAWPVLPSLVSALLVRNDEHTDLPVMSPNINFLIIDSMPNIQVFPLLPAFMTWMDVRNAGFTSITIPETSGALVYIDSMPALQSVEVHDIGGMSVEHSPLVTTVIADGVASPFDDVGLGLVELPLLTDLQVGPGIDAVHGSVLPLLTDLGPLPNSVNELVMTLVDLSALTAFNDSLTHLTIYGGALTTLPALPNTLEYLVLENFPLTTLPALPDVLIDLAVMTTQVECLPLLPDGLLTLDLTGSPITCMPNHPAAAPQLLPLCNILNTFCPEINPMATGTVFRDDDGDGIQDAGEPPLANVTLSESPSGYLTGTDSLGHYAFTLPVGTHTITIADAVIPFVQQQLPADHTVPLNTVFDVVNGLDFAVQPDTVVPDLDIFAWNEVARPGFDQEVFIHIHNGGTTAYGVQVRMAWDPLFTFVSATQSPTDTFPELVWEFDSLAFQDWNMLHATFNVPVATVLGTAYTHAYTILPFAEDVDTLNNTASYVQEVVGSYDPNDKQVFPAVLHPDSVAAGVRVDYLIRFQNTGTFYAERVLVTDTLSTDLQLSTFRFENSSHPCEWFIRDGAVHFVFNEIFLPDSITDEPNSHGHVRFSIVPATSLPAGWTVPNEANIYFDFNAPVITEPAVLSIELPTDLGALDAMDAKVFPVPTTAQVRLLHHGRWTGARASLLDAQGRILSTQRINGNNSDFDLSGLQPGTYLLRLALDGTVVSYRLIKQ